MNNPINPEPDDEGSALTQKDWLIIGRKAFILILVTILGFIFMGGLSGNSDNFLGKKFSSLVHKNPIKDPVLVKATVVNNPFIRYEGTTKSGYMSECRYELKYSFQGESFTGEVLDSVKTDRGDSKFYGCTPTSGNLTINISKGDPKKLWLEPSVSRDDKFVGLVLFVIFIGILNWLRLKIVYYFKKDKK